MYVLQGNTNDTSVMFCKNHWRSRNDENYTNVVDYINVSDGKLLSQFKIEDPSIVVFAEAFLHGVRSRDPVQY